MAGSAKRPNGVEFESAAYMRALAKRVAKLQSVTEIDVLKAAVTYTNEAKQYAPVRTGFLRSTIYWVQHRDANGFWVGIYCRAPYWRWVEFGTSRMRAQPFIRPALVAARLYLIKRFGGGK